MEITAAQVKALRDATGAGMMDCKTALQDAGGDFEQAKRLLRERGQASAGKRTGRSTNEGIVTSYLHTPDPNLPPKLGVLVELDCETDFVAKTEQFRSLARDLALHVAAADPAYVSREDVPPEEVAREREIYAKQAEGKPAHIVERIVEGRLKDYYKQVALLDQEYIRDTSRTIRQMLDELSGTLGEKLVVRRFVRFRVGDES
ncbi:MAG TPA: translation elongation factor Ts [Actinomycetes bacterium]|nr:translation elongation factor Ts [Actinomycetes bacterium]